LLQRSTVVAVEVVLHRDIAVVLIDNRFLMSRLLMIGVFIIGMVVLFGV
jgi:hypothetical protein